MPFSEGRGLCRCSDLGVEASRRGGRAPHFEHLSRGWAARYASAAGDLPLGDVGPDVVNDRASRAQHEIDVMALGARGRRGDVHAPIAILGEAKSTNDQRTTSVLAGLERIRAVLLARGLDAGNALLVLFSRAGFTADLVTAAAERDEVRLAMFGEQRSDEVRAGQLGTNLRADLLTGHHLETGRGLEQDERRARGQAGVLAHLRGHDQPSSVAHRD